MIVTGRTVRQTLIEFTRWLGRGKNLCEAKTAINTDYDRLILHFFLLSTRVHLSARTHVPSQPYYSTLKRLVVKAILLSSLFHCSIPLESRGFLLPNYHGNYLSNYQRLDRTIIRFLTNKDRRLTKPVLRLILGRSSSDAVCNIIAVGQ